MKEKKDHAGAKALAKGPDAGAATSVIGGLPIPVKPSPGVKKPLGAKEVIPFAWKLLGSSSGIVLTLFKAVEKADVEAQLERVTSEGFYHDLRLVPLGEKVNQHKAAKAFIAEATGAAAARAIAKKAKRTVGAPARIVATKTVATKTVATKKVKAKIARKVKPARTTRTAGSKARPAAKKKTQAKKTVSSKAAKKATKKTARSRKSRATTKKTVASKKSVTTKKSASAKKARATRKRSAKKKTTKK